MTTATIQDDDVLVDELPELALEFQLTEGQQAAYEAFTAFLLDENQPVFILKGYAGVGKSTLVKTLLERLPNIIKTAALVGVDLERYQVQLTATTNKACEALAELTKQEVCTIHSFLGLRMHTDYDTMKTKLVASHNTKVKDSYILFIDEASFIEPQLIKFIFQYTNNCKIIFMGDPAQLTPVNSNDTPVFNMKAPTAELTEVVRQAKGNPIIDMATAWRMAVITGKYNPVAPDGHFIKHLPRGDFDQAIVDEFTRPAWSYKDSKVLAWTNAKVITYNHGIRDLAKGSPHFQVGDYAIANAYVANSQGRKLKTDQTVYIGYISAPSKHCGVAGLWMKLDGGDFFVPNDIKEWKLAEKRFMAASDHGALRNMENSFVDLRAAYSCTVNKSQGSTYDKVFIDLDDIGKCRNDNLLARMLYVAISRARSQVLLTGDIC